MGSILRRGETLPPVLTQSPLAVVWLWLHWGWCCKEASVEVEGAPTSQPDSMRAWETQLQSLSILEESGWLSFVILLSFFKEGRSQNRKATILRMTWGCHLTRLIGGHGRAYMLALHLGYSGSACKSAGLYWLSSRSRSLKSGLQTLVPDLENHLVSDGGRQNYNLRLMSFIQRVCPNATWNFWQYGNRDSMMLNAGPGIFWAPQDTKCTWKPPPSRFSVSLLKYVYRG